MAKRERILVPDLSSPTGIRAQKVEKPTKRFKSYNEIHDEVWGTSTEPASAVEVLSIVNGLLQDIKNIEAENAKTS